MYVMKPMACCATMVLNRAPEPAPAKAPQVTVYAPPSSASPSPAPQQLAQGAPTPVAETAPASSAPSLVVLAKEEEIKKLFLSETGLAPPTAAALSTAVAAAQGAAASEKADLAPGLGHPAPPGLAGTIGKSPMLIVGVSDVNLFHNEVS